MSVEFFSREGTSYTPTYKTGFVADPTTTFTVWTPASGKKIVLTDIQISQAAAGTIRAYFFPSADTTAIPTLIFESLLGGSAAISQSFGTPLVNNYSNGILRIVAGANGLLFVNLGGFEI